MIFAEYGFSQIQDFTQVSDISLLSNLTNPLASSSSQEIALNGSTNRSQMVLPLDAGVINIKNYGAIPDDGKDDTAAIQRALDENDGDLRRVIYFPNGEYNIVDRLAPGLSSALNVNGNDRTSFLGESRDGVVLKLADDHPDFQDSGSSKAIFSMNPTPGFSFHSSLRNMTFDVGQGNAGAIGLRYFSNNGGSLDNVKIVSEDRNGVRAGFVGLDLYVDNNGPTLIKNVEIVGFDTGIRDEWGLWGHTMENIRLERQQVVGYQKGGQTVSIRNLTSLNDVPTVKMVNSSAALTLLDANFQTISSASSNPAIVHEYGSLFVRNLTTSGYTAAIASRDGSTYAGPNVDEYAVFADPDVVVQNPVVAKWSTHTTTLNLPVLETPDVPWETDLTQWAGPQQFGGIAGDGQDDTAALQAAIDSGVTTIYLPGTSSWDINGDIYIRGNVQRVTAFSRLNGNGRFIVVDQDTSGNSVTPSTLPGTVSLEHMWTFRDIEHRSNRTLVLKDLEGANVTAGSIGNGDLFIEDIVGNVAVSNGRRVWARQLNTEYGESPITTTGPEDAGIINDGGQLWIMGLKTEKGSVKIETKNGGQTELLGAHIAQVGNNPNTNEPILRSEDSSVSYVNVRTSSFSDDNYNTLVDEIRGNESRKTDSNEGFLGVNWATGDGVVLTRYVGTSTPPPTASATGLQAQYFDDANFTNLKLIRTDTSIDFNWGLGSPDPLIDPDTFSVRWTGQLQPLYSERYQFYTTSDDGVRLWVNGQLIIDRWVDQSATEVGGTIDLVAGQKYDIRLEYYENGGESVSQLRWSSPSQLKQIIPSSQYSHHEEA